MSILGNLLLFPQAGGGVDLYAAISVLYPAGSTCTATNGTITLTAADTSGEYIFSIPEPASLPETWTVSCTDGTNTDSKIVTITEYGQVETITLNYISITLDDNSWATISEVSKAGTGNLYWDVGDCKEITLNGKIGAYLTLSNVTLCVFILDFNHPINKSTADNNIIWGGFKTALTGGTDVTLCESGYGSTSNSGKHLNINHVRVNSTVYNSNYGGWKGCDARYDILGGVDTAPNPYNSAKTTSTVGYDATNSAISTPVADTIMAALPSDLRAAIRLWTRYIDYVGNSSNIDANCSTPTVDAISLLTEYEVFGERTYANTYEKDHQNQMTYYANGNSKIRYKYDDTNTASTWWLASARSNSPHNFCAGSSSGTATGLTSRVSYGIAPAFRT